MPSRLEMLRSFVASKPGDPFPRYALAHELKNGGDLAGAWAECEALLRDHAGYVAGYLHAGNTLLALGRVDEARAVYRKGIETATASGDGHARGELEGALASLG
jgi:tetratricopeptide (TPR) repeat protein